MYYLLVASWSVNALERFLSMDFSRGGEIDPTFIVRRLQRGWFCVGVILSFYETSIYPGSRLAANQS